MTTASVLIPTYQRAALLARALEALARQRVPPGLEWEVVVANNNSTDATPDVVNRCAERVPFAVRQVFESRQGLNYARNAALAAARGDIFAFVDDDIRPDETWLVTASGDETDFVRHVLEVGLVVVYDPAILVHHHVPRGRMRRSYFWRWIYGYAEGKVNVLPRPSGRPLFDLPRWMYPRLFRHAFRLATTPFSLRRQLDFFWELGLFVGWYKGARAQGSVGR